jgi:hypothetical protein
VARLLEVVKRWAARCGLDEQQTTTAQTLAWWYRRNYRGEVPLSDSHWARLAVRATKNGRDLPGCGTSVKDALLAGCWQGAAMPEVLDREPPPDVLAEHKETLARVLEGLSATKQSVVEARLSGRSNEDIARDLGLSAGRCSQIAREIAEAFHRD